MVGRKLSGTALALCSLSGVLAQSTVLYQTGFEPSEGFDPQYTLVGQRGWSGDGTGGNGLISHIPSMGQQAYVGIYPPVDTNATTTVWYPVDFVAPTNGALAKFSVTMQIYSSMTGGKDEFRWAVYNTVGNRLFSIDFFTDTQQIYFELQDRVLVDTGWTFGFADGPDNGLYDLEIWMDLSKNSWSALLNGAVLASGEKIAQQSTTPLNVGDIDAVWAITDPARPGDNLMLFDDYTVTSEALDSIPASMEARGVNTNGNFEFILFTQPGVHYAVDASSDLKQWFQLTDFSAENGSSIFEDTHSKEFGRRFYRLREVL